MESETVAPAPAPRRVSVIAASMERRASRVSFEGFVAKGIPRACAAMRGAEKASRHSRSCAVVLEEVAEEFLRAWRRFLRLAKIRDAGVARIVRLLKVASRDAYLWHMLDTIIPATCSSAYFAAQDKATRRVVEKRGDLLAEAARDLRESIVRFAECRDVDSQYV